MTRKYLLFFAAWLTIMFMNSCGNRIDNWNGGVYHGDIEDDVPSGYGVWKNARTNSEYVGFWLHGKKHGKGVLTIGKQRYEGEFSQDKFSGYGKLSVGDSIEYVGDWKNGKREGRGQMTDSCGREIKGIWKSDTLRYGERRDSDGVYNGQLDFKGRAVGHGIYLSDQGEHYEGFWSNDKRSGFGFSVSATRQLRAGEWKNNHYLGERIMYTSERIYGIDISKYQHEIGRKRYAINWKALRIKHLGTISKKKVNGDVNFNISFIYIKSTEGGTLKNRYYSNDYVQARKHGYHVGSYHFFTTTSPVAKQAKYFLRHSYFRKGDFPPVLDVEPTHSQIVRMGGTKVLLNRIVEWMKIVERRVGVKPILYVSQSFVNKYLAEAPGIKNNYMVWIARYGEYKPDVTLIYWQLCPDGRVEGIHGEVDINVFNGYRDQFDEFITSKRIRK